MMKTTRFGVNTAVTTDRTLGVRPWLLRTFAHPAGLMTGRALILLSLLTVWELSSGTLLPKFWVSSPSSIFGVLIGWIANGSLWGHLFATLLAMILGYGLGAIFGIAVGLFLGFSPRVERVAAPFITALYALPKIALAPLFVIFLGIGIESKVALVAVIVFFLLLYNTLDGVNDIDRDLVQVLSLMGATRREVVRKVLIPGTVPWIFTGLRIAVRYAWTAAILGELIAGNQGIGFLIEYSAGQFSTTGVFAAVFVLVICSLLMTEFLTRTEASALRWRI
jgi:NitT/TauT family transport system permease protein